MAPTPFKLWKQLLLRVETTLVFAGIYCFSLDTMVSSCSISKEEGMEAKLRLLLDHHRPTESEQEIIEGLSGLLAKALEREEFNSPQSSQLLYEECLKYLEKMKIPGDFQLERAPINALERASIKGLERAPINFRILWNKTLEEEELDELSEELQNYLEAKGLGDNGFRWRVIFLCACLETNHMWLKKWERQDKHNPSWELRKLVGLLEEKLWKSEGKSSEALIEGVKNNRKTRKRILLVKKGNPKVFNPEVTGAEEELLLEALAPASSPVAFQPLARRMDPWNIPDKVKERRERPIPLGHTYFSAWRA
ncbi:hypothetical protein T439DRAFT_381479 [Meredithblackwellia eburnea MCA 4105]